MGLTDAILLGLDLQRGTMYKFNFSTFYTFVPNIKTLEACFCLMYKINFAQCDIEWHRQIFSLTFWSVNDQPLRVPKQMIPHMKALIFSSFEPEGQRAWPPNKAAMP